jgi:hypothetical protein
LFTLSFILLPRGSAHKVLLPNALGPNSALPFAIPNISPASKLSNDFLIGYGPSMLFPN